MVIKKPRASLMTGEARNPNVSKSKVTEYSAPTAAEVDALLADVDQATGADQVG